MAKIAQNVGDVHVLHPETNQPVVLHPGDPVPSALRELVGSHCLEQDDEVAPDITTAPAAGPSQTAVLDSETLEAIAAARKAEAERAEAKAREKAEADAKAKAAEDAKAAKAKKAAETKAAADAAAAGKS